MKPESYCVSNPQKKTTIKILRLPLSSDEVDKVEDCAKTVSQTCAAAYGRSMLTNPSVENLCIAIPLKVKCLMDGRGKCSADILQHVLEVFPSEGLQVLSVLCST